MTGSVGSSSALGKAPASLVSLRRALHRRPELSGAEAETAAHIAAHLAGLDPDRLLTGLGGHGVAAIFAASGAAAREGPTLLFRCELDGLPITEISDFDWRSERIGKGHLCGHDGHMAILCGLAAHFAAQRPARGRVILLFQPAEETGAGAADVLADPRFSEIKPDFAFALHNLPGLPLHAVGIRPGPFTFASEGLAIRLTGRTAHAAQPEQGCSPGQTLATLMQVLPELPRTLGHPEGQSLITLSHARLGEAAFGIAPGDAEIWLTIRAINDALQSQLLTAAEARARQAASAAGLGLHITRHENFAAGHNDPAASAIIEAAVDNLALQRATIDAPFRWSEDFGRFGAAAPSALFVLGAGEDHPGLHNPDYDFPDALLVSGVAMFSDIARQLCG
ncbi:amidohydrolase [Pseudohoeflea coraliihabitans]|uniref:Amidohydrolase n=1 Tax=Pseudohoeflea coraliihabitans TaxID=2860393 RepID=A0ABS6WVP4_9HYPH|nr:amidohydrolase [Pseudohoeflea sp. DP4N28-3]MBW3099165.1 amidohydrolase [Pseudohoeflea sp. DP4N28-3]